MKKAVTLAGLFAAVSSLPAWAEGEALVGKPVDGAIGFQPAATELARDLQWLDGMLLVIITAICVLVTALLIWCAVRYNRRANATPGTFTHNSPLEIAWTVIPILILIVIGGFSLPILFKQQEIPEADLTIKVTGYQWYWGYEYVDYEDVAFDSYLLGHPATLDTSSRPADADITPYVLDDAMRAKLIDAGFAEDEFLLATDTSVVVPVGKTVVMQVTGADVIHSWTIPAFGVKQDAVPGRLAELWFAAEEEGVYFGQCSELCGMYHAYMPITVKVVSQQVYDDWIAAVVEAGEYVPVTRELQLAAAD
ncbi:MAG: cytochrome c oxidase subunit II [Rhodobacteraceae bacterium]|nr:cytochrome c oxidase subunit II [Paracoccaceae bacterium]